MENDETSTLPAVRNVLLIPATGQSQNRNSSDTPGPWRHSLAKDAAKNFQHQ